MKTLLFALLTLLTLGLTACTDSTNHDAPSASGETYFAATSIDPLNEHIERSSELFARDHRVAEIQRRINEHIVHLDEVSRTEYNRGMPGQLRGYFINLDINRDSLDRESLDLNSGVAVVSLNNYDEADYFVDHATVIISDENRYAARSVATDSARALRNGIVSSFRISGLAADSPDYLHDGSCAKSDYDQRWWCIDSYLIVSGPK